MPRILAIDDESSCLEIIEFSLMNKGHEVHMVDSGRKALDFLMTDEGKIDLILLDMMMPEMNGVETLENIRKIESVRNIPVVFQTGISSCEDNGIIKNENVYIIRKPYKRAELLEVVDNALSSI